jgi:NADH-quinone oxidoreductase subunit H
MLGGPVRPLATIALSLAVALLACSPEIDARLLSVTQVSSSRLEAAGRLGIEGDGFPPGREGRVVFDGTIHEPGASPRPIVVEASASALSGQRLEVRSSAELVRRFGGRGTFEGSLRVVFDAANGEGIVTGALDGVVLDIIDTTTFTGEEAIARARAARALLEVLGVEEARDATGQGIVVDHVVPGGLAARADVRKGDRIAAIGGLHIDTLSDLAPPPDAPFIELAVARPGEPEPFLVRIATDHEASLLGSAPFAPLALLAMVVAVLFTLSPLARRVRGVGAALSADAPSALRYVLSLDAGVSPRSFGARVRYTAWAFVAVISAAVALGVLPFMAHRVHGGVGAPLLALVVLGARAMEALSAEPSGSARRRARFVALGRVLALVVPLALVVAVAAVESGSLRLAGIVAAQGGEPWRWALFTSPAGLLAFPALVLAALVDGGEPSGAAGRSPTHDVAERVRLFLASGLVTALFLGGWRLPFVDTDPLDAAPLFRVLGALVFIAKAWATMIVAVRMRAHSPSAHDRSLLTRLAPSALSLAALILAALAVLETLPRELPETFGTLALGTVVVVLVWGGLGARRTRASVLGVTPFS